ncbi:hypothetical protein N7537_010411 [Penicillium hordei]|uniref:Uncharacterized protein n=1 Tax=Penicillium hordei TaxID=40994 RepID=A0AAD6GXK2_9EURO|nr:uncharacterized protein N7537_010411 [Penicillium hordei]KAJ5593507.1 hypothetical protein N7537_010411 [Penicillium hordei]
MKSTTLNIARSQAVPSNDLPVNHSQANTPCSCMADYLGKKRACWLNSEPAWQVSTDISIESTLQTQTSVRVDKRETV